MKSIVYLQECYAKSLLVARTALGAAADPLGASRLATRMAGERAPEVMRAEVKR
ncbi:MAG: hypothetical protein JO372_15100 [Solirubrobacterales bacterium]|nr:hypothetical protein [Solirubrobacterales bacterium]